MFRLDEKTKQIIKTWPLTTVRRWAAAPNVFTLDFGDYQDQYYSVQTTEGKDYQDQYCPVQTTEGKDYQDQYYSVQTTEGKVYQDQ